MFSHANAKLLLMGMALVALGLSACVALEETDQVATSTAPLPNEDESSPLAPPSFDSGLPSPLEPPPLPARTPTVVGGRGEPKTDTGSAEEMSQEEEKAAAAAVEALATLKEVPADQIEVVSAESVQFRDSSLDCPKKGMMYLQVITPGHKVILRLEGKTYDYRITGTRVILCRGGQ